MVNLSETLVLLIASFAAAAISVMGAARSFRGDENPLPNRRKFWMVHVADFYRVFLIHLAFASILLAFSRISRHSEQGYWDWLNPQIPLCFNFIFVIVVAYCLSEGNVELTLQRFLRYELVFCVIGIVLFGYSVASAYFAVVPG